MYPQLYSLMDTIRLIFASGTSMLCTSCLPPLGRGLSSPSRSFRRTSLEPVLEFAWYILHIPQSSRTSSLSPLRLQAPIVYVFKTEISAMAVQ